jgi:hypothetical protein
MYHLARFTALAVAIGLVGCGKNDGAPDFANVSGTVTYNSKPLDKGQITFSTDGRPPTAMDVVDGKFAGRAMVGSNKVAVAAFKKSSTERKLPETAKKQYAAYQAMNKSGGGGNEVMFDPGMEDYIPDEWGKESKQFRVIEAGGANNFQFEIKGNK